MFRLVKIDRARFNAPEFEAFPRDMSEYDAHVGCAVEIEDDMLVDAKTYPHYIIAKEARNDKTSPVILYPVTPDMTFIVDYYGVNEPYVGEIVRLETMDYLPDAVTTVDDSTPEESRTGRIVAVCPDKKYVYVKFDVKSR